MIDEKKDDETETSCGDKKNIAVGMTGLPYTCGISGYGKFLMETSGKLKQPCSKKDAASIQEELESYRIATPIKKADNSPKGLMAAVMRNIRSFFTVW